MVEKFHVELQEVRQNVQEMGVLALKMLEESVESLKQIDEQKKQWVLDNKGKLADMDDEIEQKTLRLIALYQPMAIDLREIACILKMVTYLNRIGRYGKNIALVIDEFKEKGHVKKLVSIPHMYQLVHSMISDALKAYEYKDISSFDDFIDREETVDELRYSVFRECLSYMIEDPKVITRCMHYTMVARYLERCADHACKMAEKITYMVTGQRVEIDCSDDTSKACFYHGKK